MHLLEPLETSQSLKRFSQMIAAAPRQKLLTNYHIILNQILVQL